MTAPAEPDVPGVQEALEALLASARTARVEVVRLTDEELVVLTDDERRPAPRPWYDALPEQAREVAQSVALRSLAAREVVVPRPLPGGEVQVSVPAGVQAVLTLQRRAPDVLLVQRRTATTSVSHVLQRLPDGTVIEEHVSSGGLHTLSVCPYDLAVEAVVDVVAPQGGALLNGPERPADAALSEGALVSSVLVGRVRDRSPVEDRCSVHAYADRVEVARAGAQAGQLVRRQVDRRGLAESVEHLLRSR